jgi:hypothetical protein
MVYDTGDLDMEFLNVDTKNIKGRQSDPILAMVEYLEKNKFLAASSSNAQAGTVETLAHNLISGLVEMSIMI